MGQQQEKQRVQAAAERQRQQVEQKAARAAKMVTKQLSVSNAMQSRRRSQQMHLEHEIAMRLLAAAHRRETILAGRLSKFSARTPCNTPRQNDLCMATNNVL